MALDTYLLAALDEWLCTLGSFSLPLSNACCRLPPVSPPAPVSCWVPLSLTMLGLGLLSLFFKCMADTLKGRKTVGRVIVR